MQNIVVDGITTTDSEPGGDMARVTIDRVPQELRQQFRAWCTNRGTTMRDEFIRHMNACLQEDEPRYFRPLVNELGDGIDVVLKCAESGEEIHCEDGEVCYSPGFTKKTREEAWQATEELYGDPVDVVFGRRHAARAFDKIEKRARELYKQNRES